MAVLNKFIPVLFLFGCASEVPTITIIDDARSDIEQIANDIKKLPVDCSPDDFAQKLNMISGKLDAAEETHALEINKCQTELDKSRTWNGILFFFFVLSCYYFLKKKLLA